MERKIKIFQSDGGGEFSSIIFQQHLQQSGIIKQTSCPYTPQQNGVAERKHRHIMETALTMLFESSLPLKYWVETVLTAVYLINRLPQTIIKMHTPHELLFKETPSYNEIKVFGCRCFPSLRDYNKTKFDKKTLPCIFVGYSPTHKGYRCLFPQTIKFIFLVM